MNKAATSGPVEAAQKEAEALGKRLASLSERTAALEVDLEKFLAYRVSMESRDMIKRWIASWIAVGVLILGITGYASYQKVLSLAVARFEGEIAPRVEEEIRAHYTAKAAEAIDAESAKVSLMIQNRTDRAMRQLVENLESELQLSSLGRTERVAAPGSGRGYCHRSSLIEISGHEGGGITVGDRVQVKVIAANLREGPGYESAIVATLRGGTEWTVLAVDGDWLLLEDP